MNDRWPDHRVIQGQTSIVGCVANILSKPQRLGFYAVDRSFLEHCMQCNRNKYKEIFMCLYIIGTVSL